MSVAMNVRIPEDLAKALDFIANHFDKPKSRCVVSALKDFVKEKMEEIEDAMDGEICLKRANDERLSWDEIERLAAEIRNV